MSFPKRSPRPIHKKTTSWEGAAKWYSSHLRDEDTFHETVIFPALKKLLPSKRDARVLDVACGDGIWLQKIAGAAGAVVGVDLSSSLIKTAKERKVRGATFQVGDAKELPRYFPAKSFDYATCILALQNIDDLTAAAKSVAGVLADGGAFIFVINHPMFRIPKQTGWGFDEKRMLEYRRIDSYMTPNEIPIETHPGRGQRGGITYSYHRPLTDYIAALASAGFVIDRLEEWTSHKTSDSGPRKKAENRARQEIPLFMAIRAVKLAK